MDYKQVYLATLSQLYVLPILLLGIPGIGTDMVAIAGEPQQLTGETM
jgi:hypothetical protein